MAGGLELGPTNQDGPASRAMGRRADEVDRAQTAGERRRAWARFVPSALAAFAEDVARRWVIVAALLLSVGVTLAGVTSEEPGLAIAGVAAGVVGAAAVIGAMVAWSYGKQWAVFLGVIALQALFLVIDSQVG